MIVSGKDVARRGVLGSGIFLIGILLVACSSFSPVGISSTPTPKLVTPVSTFVSSMTLQTYTGKGFTIDHPQDWKVDTTTANTIAFKDAQGGNLLSITLVSNPGGKKSAKDMADGTLLLLEAGMTESKALSMSSTITVGGKSWVQRGVEGTLDTKDGDEAPGRTILLVNNHPDHSSTTQTYEIIYSGPNLTFTQVNVIFQTMLQSFKFTS